MDRHFPSLALSLLLCLSPSLSFSLSLPQSFAILSVEVICTLQTLMFEEHLSLQKKILSSSLSFPVSLSLPITAILLEHLHGGVTYDGCLV